MTVRVLLLSAVLFLASCTGLRTVTDEDPLYTGPEVEINGEASREKTKELEAGIENGLRPLPNGTFLRIFRPRLSIYHLAREAKPDAKGFRRWLKYQVGEAPVTLSKVDLIQNHELARQYMIDNGFFEPVVRQNVHKRRKTAGIQYQIQTGPEYKIAELKYPKSDSLIQRTIAVHAPGSLVKPGDAYNLKNLKAERLRLDSTLKNSGFFYFQPDFLQFKADTSGPGNTVKLSLGLKDDIPLDAEKKMVITKVIVNSDYTFATDTAMLTMDTLVTDGVIVLVQGTPLVNPSVIVRAIAFRPGKEYMIRDHDLTL